MERTGHQFYEKRYVIESEDPYDISLNFINYMSSFGEISVTKNIVSTNGPRKYAEVHFYLERKIDRYSKIFFMFKINVDITAQNLEILSMGMNQIQIPVGGQVGDVFQSWYIKEIHPEIHNKSSIIIKDITHAIERYLSKHTSK